MTAGSVILLTGPPGVGETTTARLPLRHLHRQFADLGPFEPHVLTNEDTAPDQVVESVLAGVGADAYRLTDRAGSASRRSAGTGRPDRRPPR